MFRFLEPSSVPRIRDNIYDNVHSDFSNRFSSINNYTNEINIHEVKIQLNIIYYKGYNTIY